MADWLCWHVGTVGDPKFAAVAKRAGVSKLLAVCLWAYLLERAKVGEPQGTFGKFDHEDAALLLETSEENISSTLSAMRDKGLITETKICKWDRRQHKPSTERTRAFRERLKHDGTLRNGSEQFETVQNGSEHAQDRTGQDITKISNTVPVAARANGSNGHGHKNGNGSKIDVDPLRASRALNGEPSKSEKHEKFEARTIQYARAHCPDLVPEMIRLQLSEDPHDQRQRKQIFNQVDAEFQARSKAGTLIEGWKDY